MSYLFDEPEAQSMHADGTGAPLEQVRKGYAALVCWLLGRGWLEVTPEVADAHRRFVDGKVGADTVYQAMGHRLTSDDVVPERLDAVFDRFGEFFGEGEAWERVEALYGEQLRGLEDGHAALEPLFARLDQLCGVGPVQAPRPDPRPTIPILQQLGMPGVPLRPWQLIELLEGIGFGLAMAAHNASVGESPWVGVNREGGAYEHATYRKNESKASRIRVEPRKDGGHRAWTTGVPHFAVARKGDAWDIEVERLSEQDRTECLVHLRAGAGAFAEEFGITDA